MKKAFITVISTTFVLTSIGIGYTATKLTDKDKSFFYTTLFSDIDTDMFTKKATPIVVNGKELGEFRSSTKGIITYLSVYRAFKQFSGIEELEENELIAKYAGIPIYQKGYEQSEIKYYNPNLIKWGVDNLYIEPNTQIYGVKAKDIYTKSFQRFFRLTTESYIFLNKKKGMYKDEQKKYMDNYKKSLDDIEDAPDSIDYLTKKFDNSLRIYNNDEFTYSPGIAVGFWLRRGIDKTDKVLWSGLKRIMNNYDKEWFVKVNK